MSITSALSNANSGLSAASKRANVVSNNIANALTPGYTRRTASVSENTVAGAGAGVQFDGVSRQTDPAITNDRRRAETVQALDQVAVTTYSSLNSALGEPEDSFSLFSQYQNLETSLRSLSQTPESQALHSRVIEAAKALTASFNQLSSNVQSIRRGADTDISQQVLFVNDRLNQIEELNHEISITGSGGRDSTALEDQRELLIDEVSSIIPVREVRRNSGKIDLITDQGVFLIAGKARKVEFTQATAITPNETLANGSLSGLSVEGTDITPGNAGTFSLQQGSLAGLFESRDRIGPEFQNKLDGLARDIIERFENIDPTLAPGEPGLFTDGGAAFNPSAESGLSGRISINSAVDPDFGGAPWRLRDGIGAGAEGPAGNATIINIMLDALATLKAPPTATGLNGELNAIGAVANVTSSIGAARITAESRLSASSAMSQALLDAETAATGVDTDVELQQLILIEQAFAANARVIQTADQMVRQLLDL